MMEHRNLIREDYSLMSIDNIISRGLWHDWIDLRRQIKLSDSILNDIEQICQHYISDPYAQRYHFWYNYVKHHRERN